MADTVRLNFAYKDTDYTRQYAFDIDHDQIDNVKTKVKAVNASLTAGIADGLNTFFISDNGEEFASIKAATIISESEEALDISED